MTYDAVIFDNDGILTRRTTVDRWRTAVSEAFAAHGIEADAETVDEVLNGDVARICAACERHGVDRDSFWAHHERRAAALQLEALNEGEKPLYDDVGALADLSASLAVVSNNQHRTIEHVLDVHGLGDLFAVAYGRDSSVDGFRRRKPSPHYLERALSELDTRNALYVGDSNVDVLAADRADVDSAFVRRPHRAEYELVADPTYELESLREVVAVCAEDDAASARAD